jgi:hypothetical protein
MSFDTLVFAAVALVVFVGLACGTHIVLGPLRLLLRLGPQGGVDVFVSGVFTVVLLWMLLAVTNYRSTLSWVALLALPVCLAGLLFLGVGLFEAPKRAGRGDRRDRLFVGTALMATAFVIVYLDGREPYVLFSDVAQSVSQAPGP